MPAITCPLCDSQIDPKTMKCTNCKRGISEIHSFMVQKQELDTLVQRQDQQRLAGIRAEQTEASRQQGIRDAAAAAERDRLSGVQEKEYREAQSMKHYQQYQRNENEKNNYFAMLGCIGSVVGGVLGYFIDSAIEPGGWFNGILIGIMAGCVIGILAGAAMNK